MSKFELYKHKNKSRQIYKYISKYIKESLNYSHIYQRNYKEVFEKKSLAKNIKNLNHNGALLPKNQLNVSFFEIFENFKPILKKYISEKSLIHFPIIIRLNNILANKNNKYSSKHPHLDSWAGQPMKSRILSFNVFSTSSSPTLEILELKKNVKIPLSKQKKYKGMINVKDCKTLYKSKKGDVIITGPGVLHKTSKGNTFRVTLECRFIRKKDVSKRDEKKFINFYFSNKKFFNINKNNTIILTPFSQIAKSRFGVDFKFKR